MRPPGGQVISNMSRPPALSCLLHRKRSSREPTRMSSGMGASLADGSPDGRANLATSSRPAPRNYSGFLCGVGFSGFFAQSAGLAGGGKVRATPAYIVWMQALIVLLPSTNRPANRLAVRHIDTWGGTVGVFRRAELSRFWDSPSYRRVS